MESLKQVSWYYIDKSLGAIFLVHFSDPLVDLDVAVHVKGSREPVLTNSLLLAAASPFLHKVLSSLNYCYGCTSRKTIILAEEQKDTVDGLLHLLHAKYMKQAPSTSLANEEPEFEKLCRRLAIRDEALASPLEQVLSRSRSDEEGDRNDEDIEMPKSQEAEATKEASQILFASKYATIPFPSEQELFGPDGNGDRNDEEKETPQFHESEAPLDESQKLNALKDGTTSSLSLAGKRPKHQRYPVRIPFEKLPQSSLDKIAKVKTSKNKSHSQKRETKRTRNRKRPKRRNNCGSRFGCAQEDDCGESDFCLDKPKFGGRGIQKQKCGLRRCELRDSRNNSHLGSQRQKDLDKKDKPVDNCIHFDYNSEVYSTTGPTATSKCVNRDLGYNFGANHDEENINQDEFEENAQSANGADRVIREASKQSVATQQHNLGFGEKTKPPNSKKVRREVFITRDKNEAKEVKERDPDYRPETSAKRNKRSNPKYGSGRLLVCYKCGQKKSIRSNLYGHYASFHFRDQLIEHIGAERKYCEEHKVMLKGKGHIAVHFGGVHNMVEHFLPSQYHISLKSQEKRATKAKKSGQYDTALEKTAMNTTADNEDHIFVEETGEAYSPTHSFGRECKRGSIQLGPQKRNERVKVLSPPEEEFSSGSEDFSNEEHQVYQSALDEQFEEQNERGEDVQQYDWENGNIKDELPDLMNEDSIDVKDNILAYADDAKSPGTLLSEFLEGDLDIE